MKKIGLVFVHFACASVLIAGACSNSPKTKLQGTWHSKNSVIKLNITDKSFLVDGAEPEDYFVKGDTIFTSYQGNLPYTSFVVQKVDDHYLKLMGPDSIAMEYNR